MNNEQNLDNPQNQQLNIAGVSRSVVYKPTMMLRYKWKEIKTPIAENFTAITNEARLEQMWIGDLGEEDWREIETVK